MTPHKKPLGIFLPVISDSLSDLGVSKRHLEWPNTLGEPSRPFQRLSGLQIDDWKVTN